MAQNETAVGNTVKDSSHMRHSPSEHGRQSTPRAITSPWWWLIFPVLQLAALVIMGVCQSLLADAPYNQSIVDWQICSDAVAYFTLPLTMAFTALVVPHQDRHSARVCRWTTIVVSLIQAIIGIALLVYFVTSADNVGAQIAVHAVYLLLQAGLVGWWIAITTTASATPEAAPRIIRPSNRTWLTLLIIPILLTVATIIWLAVAGIESGSVMMAFSCLGLFLAVLSAPMTAISGLLALQGRRRLVAFWVPVGEIVFLSTADSLVFLEWFQDYTQETMVYAPVAIILLIVSIWLPIWLAKSDEQDLQANPRR